MGGSRFGSVEVTLDPERDAITRLASTDPESPFITWPYVAARAESGERPVLFSWADGARGCLGFVRGRRFGESLEIPSIAASDGEADDFWRATLAFCRRRRVTTLEAGSFGSQAAVLPRGLVPAAHRDRWEFVLDLTAPTWEGGLSSNHKRNAAKARKAGITVRRTTDVGACEPHVRLQRASFERRTQRGEEIAFQENLAAHQSLVRHGAGELFQAVQGDEVVSSILVLRSAKGAYYQSAGTSPDGMAIGASPLLIVETARMLSIEGVRSFNLGGAEPTNPGLYRFKTEFGARAVPLVAATYHTAGRLHRKALSAARLLRDPRRLSGALIRVERFVAYAGDPRRAQVPPSLADTELRALTDDELRALGRAGGELHEAGRRFDRLGYNTAHGVFVGGALAHIAWLIDAEHDRRNRVRNVTVRDGEAEITHCETAAPFRGRGLYPFAIRTLCGVAAARGIRRVFMITNVSNVASQHGIERAGLTRRGTIARVALPWAGNRTLFTYRGHRWPRLRSHG